MQRLRASLGALTTCLILAACGGGGAAGVTPPQSTAGSSQNAPGGVTSPFAISQGTLAQQGAPGPKVAYAYFQSPNSGDGSVALTDGSTLWTAASNYASNAEAIMEKFVGQTLTVIPSTLITMGEDENLPDGRMTVTLDGTVWDTMITGSDNMPYVGLMALPPGAKQVQGSVGISASTFGEGPTGDVVKGLNGDLWFAGSSGFDGYGDFFAGDVGYAKPGAQTASNLPLANASENPLAITVGPDNTYWVAETHGGTTYIDRYTTTGALQSSNAIGNYPIAHMATGPDNSVWFITTYKNAVGRISATFAVTTFPLPTSSYQDITLGGDGALWVTGSTTIDRITTSGAITVYQVPSSLAPGELSPWQIIGTNQGCNTNTLDVGMRNGGVMQLTI